MKKLVYHVEVIVGEVEWLLRFLNALVEVMEEEQHPRFLHPDHSYGFSDSSHRDWIPRFHYFR